MNLKFKVLNGGKLPTRAHREDAGFDLYSPFDVVMYDDTNIIRLRVCVEIPKGYVGFIMGRSSLNKKGVICLTGVIDSGYTGEIAVVLNCNGKHYIPYGVINVKADVGNGKGCCFISIELSDKTIEDALKEEIAEC